jgi:hypothetical protein
MLRRTKKKTYIRLLNLYCLANCQNEKSQKSIFTLEISKTETKHRQFEIFCSKNFVVVIAQRKESVIAMECLF